MIGAIIIIFVLIPESPWWLVSKDKIDSAATVLQRYNAGVKDYNVPVQLVSHSSNLFYTCG